jgi:IS5 family transposase
MGESDFCLEAGMIRRACLARHRTVKHTLILDEPPMADESCEKALYDVPVFREFCRIDLGSEQGPDATARFHFRHLLEAHESGSALFAKVGERLQTHGLKFSGGTIVDATRIEAPSSTQNRERARDPERHSTKKGNPWHFGMKVHIGADSRTGLVHHASVTAAHAHDSHEVPNLLYGDETRFYSSRLNLCPIYLSLPTCSAFP